MLLLVVLLNGRIAVAHFAAQMAITRHRRRSLHHLVEEESDYYHLNLNKSKCSYQHYNCKGTIKFRDGTKMKQEATPIYLGAIIDDSTSPRTEIHKEKSSIWVLNDILTDD